MENCQAIAIAVGVVVIYRRHSTFSTMSSEQYGSAYSERLLSYKEDVKVGTAAQQKTGAVESTKIRDRWILSARLLTIWNRFETFVPSSSIHVLCCRAAFCRQVMTLNRKLFEFSFLLLYYKWRREKCSSAHIFSSDSERWSYWYIVLNTLTS